MIFFFFIMRGYEKVIFCKIGGEMLLDIIFVDILIRDLFFSIMRKVDLLFKFFGLWNFVRVF